MKSLLFSVFLLFTVLISVAQNVEKPITIYENTTSFLQKEGMVNTVGIIKSESEKHVHMKKILNPDPGKQKRGLTPWAIKYNEAEYFNLGYSDDLNNWNLFARFDIIGKYSAIFIDKDSPKIFYNNGITYGGGVSGALFKDSVKWNKAWIDKNGDKKRILFIDSRVYTPKNVSRVEDGILGNYLTRDQLKELITVNKIDVQGKAPKDLSFEEVAKIIQKLNEE
jgi:hypothetical protein